jgi:hypothetical protein
MADARRDRLGQQRRPVRIAAHRRLRRQPALGNAYAGGFYLRAPSACLPLIFTVDGRSTSVRFGIGKRCGG